MGGFGITYKATEIASGHTVVIKENFPSGCVYRNVFDEETVQPYPNRVKLFNWSMENFQKEAITLINLPYHPNVVRVLAAFYANNTGYIVMKRVKGISLHKLYPEHSNIPCKALLSFINNMLGALAHLHEYGVIHRDIKPENIIITPDDTPVLIDFGAARISTKNRKAKQIGTFGYAPPEQISKNCYDDVPKPHIDLYALGATCYRLITGREPMYNTDLLTANKIARRQYPRYVLAAIDKARNPDPLKRWQSAAEWQNELNNAAKNVNPVVSILSMILTVSFVLFLPLIVNTCDKPPKKEPPPEIKQPPEKPTERPKRPIKSPKPHAVPPVVTTTIEPVKDYVPTSIINAPSDKNLLEALDNLCTKIDLYFSASLADATLVEILEETLEPTFEDYYIPPPPEIEYLPTNIEIGPPIDPPIISVTQLPFRQDNKFYTIQVGDTIFGIARKHRITVDRLRELNNIQISDVFHLVAGQHLRIAE